MSLVYATINPKAMKQKDAFVLMVVTKEKEGKVRRITIAADRG